MSKKLALRTCIACQTIRQKKDMIRLVVNKNNQVNIDPTGKLPGRGGYICNQECLKKATKENTFSRAFRKKVKPPKTNT